MWPGFNYIRVEFVGSLLFSRGFFPSPSVFPSSQKPTFDLAAALNTVDT